MKSGVNDGISVVNNCVGWGKLDRESDRRWMGRGCCQLGSQVSWMRDLGDGIKGRLGEEVGEGKK